jgi:hypothetical protein
MNLEMTDTTATAADDAEQISEKAGSWNLVT